MAIVIRNRVHNDPSRSSKVEGR